MDRGKPKNEDGPEVAAVYGNVSTEESADINEMESMIEQGEPPDAAKVVVAKSGSPRASPTASSASQSAIVFGVALYAFCSSTLLVINKVAMVLVPSAPLILFFQFVSSAAAVRALLFARPDMDIELMKWEKARPFALATLVFYLCLFSNTQALKSVNVETVIVVRSCSPIAVAFLERATLGRPLPSILGMVALAMIAGGACLYVVTDQGFRIEGYSWLCVYFVFIVGEMVFVKFIVETVPMSTWTRVYYNNALSIPMAMVSAFAMGGSTSLESIEWTPAAIFAVGLSCVVGVAISYAGFNLRKLVSATTFTVVGVVCKLITILINDIMWNNHSNFLGHVGLFICIGAGFAYEKTKGKK